MPGPNETREKSEDEAALDLCDQRHVDTLNRRDQLYCIGSHLSETHAKFDFEGQESEQQMRDHIKAKVPARLIRDQFGRPCALETIMSHHLPRLQANLWREWPTMAANVSSWELEHITDKDNCAAAFVSSVASTLERGYVFVLHDRLSSMCVFPLCRKIHESFGLKRQPYDITLEPLVDWRTLDLVDDASLFQRQIQTYRRNSKLRLDYCLDIRPFLPRKPTTFCVECLQFLWDRRVESWYIKQQFPDVVRPLWREEDRAELCGHDPSIPRSNSKNGDLDVWEEEKSNDSTHAWSSTTSSEDEPGRFRQARDGLDLLTTAQLDGAWDFKPPRNTSFRVWEDPVKVGETNSFANGVRSQTTTPPFVHTHDSPGTAHNTIIPSSSISAGQITTNPSHTSMSRLQFNGETRYESFRDNVDPVGMPFKGTFALYEDEKYPDAHAGVPSGPPQNHQHKPDITISAPPMEDCGPIGSVRKMLIDAELRRHERVREYRRELHGEALVDQPASVERRSSLPSQAFITNTETFLPDPMQNPEQARSHTPEPRSQSVCPPLPTPKSPATFTPVNVSPAKFPHRPNTPKRINLPDLVIEAPEYEFQPTTPKPAKSVGRKRVSSSPVVAQPWPLPPGRQSSPTLLQREKRIPTASQKICTCHKPAQTFDVKIVECRNRECVVAWYHYRCIDKRAKLSSLYGKWMCDICKCEKFFGKSTRTTDFASAFTSSEIVGGLGGTGVRNAYGLGVAVGGSLEADRRGESNADTSGHVALVCEPGQRTLDPWNERRRAQPSAVLARIEEYPDRAW